MKLVFSYLFRGIVQHATTRGMHLEQDREGSRKVCVPNQRHEVLGMLVGWFGRIQEVAYKTIEQRMLWQIAGHFWWLEIRRL